MAQHADTTPRTMNLTSNERDVSQRRHLVKGFSCEDDDLCIATLCDIHLERGGSQFPSCSGIPSLGDIPRRPPIRRVGQERIERC